MNTKVSKFCFDGVCAIMCLVALLLIMCSGCAMFDFDGNGEFDPITYLEGVDVTVGLVDEDGTVYTVAVDELGKDLLGQYIQAKTGYLFEAHPNGDITVTDPNGMTINLKRKE